MGTMRQRSPGTWELTVSAGCDASIGKYRRVIRTVQTTSKREAKAALAALETEVRAGRVGPDDVTVAELMERWLEHLEAKGRSANTLYGYRRYIERLVGRNVAKLASPPSMPQTVQHPPTPEEVRALLIAASELDPTLGAYVRLVAATGMRRAEACAVRWGDLDLEAKTLTVARSHVAPPGVREDKETKTRSTRTVILDDATVEMLAQLRDMRAEIGIEPELPVFTDDGGTPWRPDGASTRWARVRKKAGVDKSIRLHDLRHWQATQLLDAGVPLPTVAARLGHASGMTTMKIYAHRTAQADEQAASIVGDVLIYVDGSWLFQSRKILPMGMLELGGLTEFPG